MKTQTITYPRKRLGRGLMRGLGRLVLPLFFRIQVVGRQNFPRNGPLIVAGNHSAIMEVVQLFVYTPWQVEFLGGGDVPHEWITEIVSRIVGYIPYQRGQMDRATLELALGVLQQGGVLGIFPEGGIWQTTERSVQPGIAWLSEKSQAPVLPVYFGASRGALGAALRMKRPRLAMTVGGIIPPAQYQAGISRKENLRSYAWQVMEAIDALASPSDATSQPPIRDESFELNIIALTSDGKVVEIPANLSIRHPADLARLLHTPTVLKIFRKNLRLPIQPLQTLSSRSAPTDIAQSCTAMLDYLANQNPYLLTYRFGPRQGEAMRLGLQELEALARWATQQDIRLQITPIRRYFDLVSNQPVCQTEQGVFENWM